MTSDGNEATVSHELLCLQMCVFLREPNVQALRKLPGVKSPLSKALDDEPYIFAKSLRSAGVCCESYSEL